MISRWGVALPPRNQSPEQKARDNIDMMLEVAGWKVQDKKTINFDAGPGIAVREYQTDVGPADYVLFVDQGAVGVIEAKPENWGQNITTVEDQSAGYAEAKLKWINNNRAPASRSKAINSANVRVEWPIVKIVRAYS